MVRLDPLRRLSLAGMLGREEEPLVSFVLSSFGLNLATVIANLAVLRWIGPAVMGIWQTLLVALSYITIVRLGVVNGLNRELPYLLGTGETQKAYRLAATAQFYSILCATVGAGGVLASLWVLWARGVQWRVGLIALAVLAPAFLYQAYLQSTFRSAGDYARLAYVQFWQAGTTLPLPLFVYLLGFVGLCLHAVMQAILITGLTHRWRPIRVAPRIDGGSMKLLMATGVPLFLTSYATTLALGFDRIILLHRGGLEAVGQYTPALWVMSGMALLPSALVAYYYPRMSFRLGQTNRRSDVWRLSVSTALLSVALTTPVVVVGWWLMPWVIEHVIPRYEGSVSAVRISLLAGWLAGMASVATALRSLKSWNWLYFYVAVFVASKWTFPWYLSRQGNPVHQVALGNLIAVIMTTVLAVWVSFQATHGRAEFAPNGEAPVDV